MFLASRHFQMERAHFDASVVCISLLWFEILSTLTDFNETWYKYYDIGDNPTLYYPSRSSNNTLDAWTCNMETR
jgi:hypothetical protein